MLQNFKIKIKIYFFCSYVIDHITILTTTECCCLSWPCEYQQYQWQQKEDCAWRNVVNNSMRMVFKTQSGDCIATNTLTYMHILLNKDIFVNFFLLARNAVKRILTNFVCLTTHIFNKKNVCFIWLWLCYKTQYFF